MSIQQAAPSLAYSVKKTYGHNLGLSCCFRQWRATDTHCRFLHGYAISVELDFSATELDGRNWVIGFGSLKPVRAHLEWLFDHTTLIAEDDPEMGTFRAMEERELVQLRVLPAVGCEAFARTIYEWVEAWLNDQPDVVGRVHLRKVTVHEHGANASAYGFAPNSIGG